MKQINQILTIDKINKKTQKFQIPIHGKVFYQNLREEGDEFLENVCEGLNIEPVYMRMDVKIVAAVGMNLEIGRNNNLLDPFSLDFKRFKEITKGGAVLMGRKTAESLPGKKPLPGRENVILSRNKYYKLSGFKVVESIEEAFSIIDPEKEIFCIGGGEIYKEFLPYTETMFLTEIQKSYPDADTYFPKINPKDWNTSFKKFHEKGEGTDFDFYFTNYLRQAYSSELTKNELKFCRGMAKIVKEASKDSFLNVSDFPGGTIELMKTLHKKHYILFDNISTNIIVGPRFEKEFLG